MFNMFNVMSTRYVTCAETAKLLRVALKPWFPGVRFSVRSHTYSGGASIDVRWQDGPRPAVVDSVAQKFAGATFDGMTDCKSFHDSIAPNGERVRYGAHFVFCQRDVTNRAALEADALAMIRARCVLEEDGRRFGTRWLDDLARGVVGDMDFRDGATAMERAFQRVVLMRRDEDVTIACE